MSGKMDVWVFGVKRRSVSWWWGLEVSQWRDSVAWYTDGVAWWQVDVIAAVSGVELIIHGWLTAAVILAYLSVVAGGIDLIIGTAWWIVHSNMRERQLSAVSAGEGGGCQVCAWSADGWGEDQVGEWG